MLPQRFPALLAATVLFLPLMTACNAPGFPPAAQDAPPTPAFDTVEGDLDLDTEVSPDTIPSRQASECPDLDSTLFQLTQVSNPTALAEQLGFRVTDGKVQVLLVLASEDTEFLRDWGVEPGTQSGTQVQAFVPIGQLCDLANTDEVLAIRPSAQAVPQ